MEDYALLEERAQQSWSWSMQILVQQKPASQEAALYWEERTKAARFPGQLVRSTGKNRHQCSKHPARPFILHLATQQQETLEPFLGLPNFLSS